MKALVKSKMFSMSLYIDGSRAVGRVSLSYSTKMSK